MRIPSTNDSHRDGKGDTGLPPARLREGAFQAGAQWECLTPRRLKTHWCPSWYQCK